MLLDFPKLSVNRSNLRYSTMCLKIDVKGISLFCLTNLWFIFYIYPWLMLKELLTFRHLWTQQEVSKFTVDTHPFSIIWRKQYFVLHEKCVWIQLSAPERILNYVFSTKNRHICPFLKGIHHFNHIVTYLFDRFTENSRGHALHETHTLRISLCHLKDMTSFQSYFKLFHEYKSNFKMR